MSGIWLGISVSYHRKSIFLLESVPVRSVEEEDGSGPTSSAEQVEINMIGEMPMARQRFRQQRRQRVLTTAPRTCLRLEPAIRKQMRSSWRSCSEDRTSSMPCIRDKVVELWRSSIFTTIKVLMNCMVGKETTRNCTQTALVRATG